MCIVVYHMTTSWKQHQTCFCKDLFYRKSKTNVSISAGKGVCFQLLTILSCSSGQTDTLRMKSIHYVLLFLVTVKQDRKQTFLFLERGSHQMFLFYKIFVLKYLRFFVFFVRFLSFIVTLCCALKHRSVSLSHTHSQITNTWVHTLSQIKHSLGEWTREKKEKWRAVITLKHYQSLLCAVTGGGEIRAPALLYLGFIDAAVALH